MFEDKMHPLEMYDGVKLYTLCILVDLISDDVKFPRERAHHDVSAIACVVWTVD